MRICAYNFNIFSFTFVVLKCFLVILPQNKIG